jgi:hypothetical protein
VESFATYRYISDSAQIEVRKVTHPRHEDRNSASWYFAFIKHAPTGDKMIICQCGELEDGVLKAGGIGTVAKDVLVNKTMFGGDVSGNDHSSVVDMEGEGPDEDG